MRVRYAVSVCAAMMALLLNPLMLQGCFMRCPEPKPPSYNHLQERFEESLTQTIILTRDEGALELEITDVLITPNYEPDYAPDYASGARSSMEFISVAYATPSCQLNEPGPDRYTLSMRLTATWIPEQGEVVNLTEGFELAATIRSISGGGIVDNILEMRAQGVDGRAWSMTFHKTLDKYKLASSVLHPEVDQDVWLIETLEEEIKTLEMSSEMSSETN